MLAIEARLMEREYPPQLVLENTSICNLTCIHCSHRELQRVKRHMKRPLWDKVVEEIGANAPDTEIWPTSLDEVVNIYFRKFLTWGIQHHARRRSVRRSQRLPQYRRSALPLHLRTAEH